MKRNDFLKKSIVLGAIGVSAPTLLNAKKHTTDSTYDKLIKQVGFNHMPNKELTTMNSVLHKANTRGSANHGWLKANHSFSFANYYNPERMHFGVLRVLNDDTIAASRGFGTHPHDNMEIITIPLEGDLKHEDNMGNGTVIKNGDIQVMSAGTGITHSEFNANNNREVKLLQIWLFPNKKNVNPRYDQIEIKSISKTNEFNQILSPFKEDQGVWIHQDAWFYLGEFNETSRQKHTIKKENNGVYIFVIEGKVKINDQELLSKDGFGIWSVNEIEMDINSNSKVLMMDIPMNV
tara:strand:- start:1702 stop:2577 length:876 start_codon:yes stop_codon:yes gene_type:complete